MSMMDPATDNGALVEPAAAARQARRRFTELGTAVDSAAAVLAEYSTVARSLVTQGAADYSATRLQDLALGDATRLRAALVAAADTIETAYAERQRLLQVAEGGPLELSVAEELAVSDAWDDVLDELRDGHDDIVSQVNHGVEPILARAAASGDRPVLLALLRKLPRYARRAGIEIPIGLRERLVRLVGPPAALDAIVQRLESDADAYDANMLAGQLRAMAAPSGWAFPGVLMRPGNRNSTVKFDSQGRIVAEGQVEFDAEALEQLFGLALRAERRQAGLGG